MAGSAFIGPRIANAISTDSKKDPKETTAEVVAKPTDPVMTLDSDDVESESASEAVQQQEVVTVTALPQVTVTSAPPNVTVMPTTSTVTVAPPTETVTVQPTVVTLTARTMYVVKDSNVRSGPSTNHGVVNTLSAGAEVTAIGNASGWSDDKQANVPWTQLSSGGYVRSDFLSETRTVQPPPSPNPAVLESGTAYVAKNPGYANVRSGPGKEYPVAYRIYEQEPVSCVGMRDGWTQLADGNWIAGDIVSCFNFGGNGGPGANW